MLENEEIHPPLQIPTCRRCLLLLVYQLKVGLKGEFGLWKPGQPHNFMLKVLVEILSAKGASRSHNFHKSRGIPHILFQIKQFNNSPKVQIWEEKQSSSTCRKNRFSRGLVIRPEVLLIRYDSFSPERAVWFKWSSSLSWKKIEKIISFGNNINQSHWFNPQMDFSEKGFGNLAYYT